MDSQFPPRCRAKYRAGSLLASGGYGAVYRAEQEALGRRVVVKLLHAVGPANSPEVARFIAEARITAALSHPHVVVVIDHDCEDGVPWIVYEHLPGPDVRGLVETAPLARAEVALIGAQVAAALDHAHSRGVLHRDIKPENVLRAAPGVYKVTDFGIAKWSTGSGVTTESGLILGTPGYLSPEQCQGSPAEPASDLYALGIMLFELFTGRRPFLDENPARLLVRHIEQIPPQASTLVPDLDPSLDSLIARLLSKAPENRPPPAQVIATLQSSFSREGTAPRFQRTVRVSHRDGPPQPTSHAPVAPGRARPAWLAGMVGVALALGLVFWRPRPRPVTLPSPQPSLQTLEHPREARRDPFLDARFLTPLDPERRERWQARSQLAATDPEDSVDRLRRIEWLIDDQEDPRAAKWFLATLRPRSFTSSADKSRFRVLERVQEIENSGLPSASLLEKFQALVATDGATDGLAHQRLARAQERFAMRDDARLSYERSLGCERSDQGRRITPYATRHSLLSLGRLYLQRDRDEDLRRARHLADQVLAAGPHDIEATALMAELETHRTDRGLADADLGHAIELLDRSRSDASRVWWWCKHAAIAYATAGRLRSALAAAASFEQHLRPEFVGDPSSVRSDAIGRAMKRLAEVDPAERRRLLADLSLADAIALKVRDPLCGLAEQLNDDWLRRRCLGARFLTLSGEELANELRRKDLGPVELQALAQADFGDETEALEDATLTKLGRLSLAARLTEPGPPSGEQRRKDLLAGICLEFDEKQLQLPAGRLPTRLFACAAGRVRTSEFRTFRTLAELATNRLAASIDGLEGVFTRVALRRVIVSDPTNTEARLRLAELYAGCDPEEALRLVLAIPEVVGEDPAAKLRRATLRADLERTAADIALQRQNYADAERHARAALQGPTPSPQARRFLVLALAEQGRLGEARAAAPAGHPSPARFVLDLVLESQVPARVTLAAILEFVRTEPGSPVPNSARARLGDVPASDVIAAVKALPQDLPGDAARRLLADRLAGAQDAAERATADQLYAELVTRHAGDCLLHRARAVLSRLRGQIDQPTLEQNSDALRVCPDDGELLTRQVELLGALRRDADVITFATAHAQNPHIGANYFLEWAMARKRSRDSDGARTALDLGLARCGEHPWLLVRRGELDLESGDVESAEKRLKRALEIMPTNALAYLLLGQLAERQGDIRGARSMLEKAKACEPAAHWTREALSEFDQRHSKD